MAVTGKFLADFASFHDAVVQSEVKLRGMETGAAKVEGSLNKMVDSFSGRKIISEATLAVEAVDRIGGASRLTEAEQAKVNRTVTEAIAKYSALGQTAPANMVALAEATKQVEAPTSLISPSMIAIGTAIGTMASNAVAALGRLAVDGIGKLVTGIKDMVITGALVGDVAENFRRMTASAGMLGETLLGTLREGTRGTVTDFELMKLVNQNLAAGLQLTDQQFGVLATGANSLAQATGGSVTDALNTMNDAMLTGRTRGIAMLTGKIDLEEAEKKYAASIGTTRDKLNETEKLEAARAAILDGVAAAVKRLGVQTDGLDEKIAQARTKWTNFQHALGITIAESPVLLAALDSIGKSLTSAFGGSQEQLIATIAKGVNKFAIGLVDAGIILVEWGRTGVQVFNALLVPQKAVTAAMVYLVERFAAGIATIAELAAKLPGVGSAFDATAAASRGAALAWGELREESSRSLSASLEAAKGQGVVDAALAKVSGALQRMKADMTEASLSTRQNIAVVTPMAPTYDAAAAAATRLSDALAKMDAENVKLHSKSLPPLAGLLGNFSTKLAPLPAQVEAFRSSLVLTAETVANAVVPAMDALTQKVAAVSLSWSAAMNLVRQGQGTMTASLPNTPKSDRPFGIISQQPRENPWWMPTAQIPPSPLIPLLGDGGPVLAGSPYIVGDRGPELFVPSSSGAIVPNGGGVGAVTVNVYGSAIASRQELAVLVREALVDFERGRGRRLGSRA